MSKLLSWRTLPCTAPLPCSGAPTLALVLAHPTLHCLTQDNIFFGLVRTTETIDQKEMTTKATVAVKCVAISLTLTLTRTRTLTLTLTLTLILTLTLTR